MKKLKLTTIFLVIVGFILSMAGLQKGYAAETPAENDTFDIVLTNMKLDDLTGWPKGEGKDNYTGAKLDLQNYFGTTSTLDGVWFEVHDAQGEIVQEGLTANGGQITFTGLKKGTYVIVQNKAKSKVDAAEQLAGYAAVPMTITLPVYKAEGGWFTTGENAVHVYPKNTVNKPTIDKVVNESDKHDTVAYGDTKTFTITSEMPEGIADYTVLTYSDQFSKGLSYQGNLTVLKNGESIPAENYQLTVVGTKAAAISVAFTKAYIQTLRRGDVITITYQASINEDAVMGTANPNDVKVTYGHNPDFTKDYKLVEIPELHTGGAKFVKQDRTTQDKLKGAKFVVQNSANKYLKQTVTDGLITATSWVDKKEEATKFISNAEGTFEVTGLAYGSANQKHDEASSTYKLVEVTAPTGYALLQDPVEFTVNASSYQDINTIKVNNSKVTIPQTGGIGSAIVIGIGLLAISFGLVTKLRTVEK
ncbi:SpaH/EbpB family LPXTG-anchored major pilin [Enterococcus cecorum]|uniref:SpaH/EbpB family LPXTG-anchored major pilin n=1 Tax=Enterococcus cecorum TaxID=44008 RepID=UPI00148C9CC3|nr:SpaH/EbpB family LPXTG-anchored major pilin [Enterococcus cecorum]